MAIYSKETLFFLPHVFIYINLVLSYPRFDPWELSSCVLLLCLYHSLSASLLSGPDCSKLILYCLCPSPGISHSSKDPGYLLVERLFKKQDLGPWFSTGVSWLLGPLGRQSHNNTLISVFLDPCVCACTHVRVHATTFNSNPTPQD